MSRGGKKRWRVDGTMVIESRYDESRRAWVVSSLIDYDAAVRVHIGRHMDLASGAVWHGVFVAIDAPPIPKGNSKRILRFGAHGVGLASPPREAAHETALRRAITAHVATRCDADDEARSMIARLRSRAVRVSCEFWFPIPKSSRKQIKPGDPHTKRPDRGNLLKFYEDAISRGVADGETALLDDDAKIAGGDVRKMWGEASCIIIRIEESA